MAPPVTHRMIGVIADGVFKVVLAAVCAAAAPLGRLFGVPVLLLVVSGVALLIGAEASRSDSRAAGRRARTRVLVAAAPTWAAPDRSGIEKRRGEGRR
ncbi:hypothetical protein AB0F03_07240 [Streptomyces sp. NPDC028722]|uniref:hypothetical protein n=1 Tax=Streptomyces sp. NPDC028722 TaxID=3155016 RepID=UPI0033F56B46